jgi:hypothetical protein
MNVKLMNFTRLLGLQPRYIEELQCGKKPVIACSINSQMCLISPFSAGKSKY